MSSVGAHWPTNTLALCFPIIWSVAEAPMAVMAAQRNVSDGNLAVCDSMDFAICPSVWCPDDANPGVLQARPHRRIPLGIPVANQHATPIGVREREVPHDLAHERLIGMWGRAEDLDPARGQFDHKDRIQRDQAVPVHTSVVKKSAAAISPA